MPHKAIGDFEGEDEYDLLLHFRYNLFAMKCLFSYCGMVYHGGGAGGDSKAELTERLGGL